jgi:RHH-type proline utilization regulon transcriptional repressor/proline dehydrogenase/delta 1-pyrroline-5-carboxylate dehydrogenase
MFATHNAHTIAAVRSIANGGVYEHQKLHGMGDDLYAEVVPADRLGLPCRVYAPVGSHEDLLPYLVRRLLENGANSSFVNRITDERVPIADLIRDPVEMVASFASIPHPKIPLPVDLLRSQNHDRKNSMGANLANDNELRALAEQLNAAVKPWQAAPLVPGANPAGASLPVTNPADTREVVGQWLAADAATVQKALANAVAAQPAWNRTPAASRAAILEHAADQLEARMPEFMALCVKEAGKSLPTASPKCAKRWTSCATTPSRRASSSATPRSCPARPVSPTSCSCTAAACSSASARGTSRWRSSWARSLLHWPPATASSPSRPSRPT